MSAGAESDVEEEYDEGDIRDDDRLLIRQVVEEGDEEDEDFAPGAGREPGPLRAVGPAKKQKHASGAPAIADAETDCDSDDDDDYVAPPERLSISQQHVTHEDDLLGVFA